MRTNPDKGLPPELNREEARAHLARQIGRLLAHEWHRISRLKSQGDTKSSSISGEKCATLESPQKETSCVPNTETDRLFLNDRTKSG
jgi:hypothetical protein